jgi:DNA polymerase-1
MNLVRRIRGVLNHPNALIIGQNFAYDIQFLSKFWLVKPKLHWDTMVAQHVLFPNTPKDLGYLASMYSTDYYRYWKEDSKEWEAKGDWDSHLLYNCDDCIYTFKIYESQRQAAENLGLMPQILWKLDEWHLACEMSMRGVLVDQATRAEMVLRVDQAVRDRQAAAERMVPAFCRPDTTSKRPFYSSSKQTQELLYTMLGLKSVFHRKTGNITANDEAIEALKIRYPYLTRLFDCLLELRSLRVFSSNYLSAAVDADGRWHCSFNVAGAKTMRWSSSENAFGRGLNLQNISSGTEED